MAINKVVYGNDTLMDLTNDTVEASNLLEGATAHDRSGQQVQGTAKQGHAIEDAEGTLLIQRGTMQIKGIRSYDDPTNQKTVIDDTAVEISWDDWQDMTEQEREAYLAEYPKVDVVGFPDADADLQLDFMTKLWENPDLTVSFEPQTITLNSADYDFLLCLFGFSLGNNYTPSTLIIPKGRTAYANFAYPSTAGSRNFARPLIYESDTSYNVGACIFSTGSTGTTTENANLVPLAIYGFKKKITVTVDAIAEDVSTSASKCMLDENTSVAEAVTWKLAGSGTSVSVDIVFNNVREFLLLASYTPSGNDWTYTFNVPKIALTDNKRFFNGYGYQSSTNLCNIVFTKSTNTFTLSEMKVDNNDRTSVSTLKVYYR